MAKLVDALALGANGAIHWRFESSPQHHFTKATQCTELDFIAVSGIIDSGEPILRLKELEMAFWNWVRNNQRTVWNIVLGFVWIVLLFNACSAVSVVNVGQIGSWSWANAIPFAAFFVIGFILIAVNARTIGAPTARVLRIALGTVIVILFLAMPFEERVRGVFNPQQSHNSLQAPATSQPALAIGVCPDASKNETRQCLVGSDWSNWIGLAEGTADNGLHFCSNAGGEREQSPDESETMFRFKSKDGGNLVKKYRLFATSEECEEATI